MYRHLYLIICICFSTSLLSGQPINTKRLNEELELSHQFEILATTTKQDEVKVKQSSTRKKNDSIEKMITPKEKVRKRSR